MPWRPPRPCPTAGCPRLLHPGERCPDHAPQPFATSSYRTKRGLTATQRKRILQRDHWRCVHCGQPATIVDHILARASGGTDAPDNLQSLCTACSATKTAAEANAARWH